MKTEQIINHNLLTRIVLWNNNLCEAERLSKDVFQKYFGKRMGEHYFDKWFYTYKQNFMLMIGYYGAQSVDGQIFCDMVAEQMQKYEERVIKMKKELIKLTAKISYCSAKPDKDDYITLNNVCVHRKELKNIPYRESGEYFEVLYNGKFRDTIKAYFTLHN